MEIGDTITYRGKPWLLRGYTRRSSRRAQFVHLESLATGRRLVVPFAEIRAHVPDSPEDGDQTKPAPS